MAQYLGFSDVFGRLVSEIPNYLTRFSNFALDLFRRVVANPIGFMSVFVSLFLANYEIDTLFNELINSLQSVLDQVNQSVTSFISSITLTSCGVGDLACYIVNGLLLFGKNLLQGLFIALLYPLSYVVGGFLQFISYTVKLNMYLIQSVLCYVADNWFPPIAGAYTAFQSFNHISNWLFQSALNAIHNGSAGRGLLSIIAGIATPLLSFVSVDGLSRGLLQMVESVFSINCSNIKPPTLNLTSKIPPTLTQSTSGSASMTYTLVVSIQSSTSLSTGVHSVYGVVGSLSTYLMQISGESSGYSVAFSLASQFTYQSRVLGAFELNYQFAPYIPVNLTESGQYFLSQSTTQPGNYYSKLHAGYGVSFGGSIKVSASMQEVINYSLKPVTPLNYSISESMHYTLGGQVTGSTIPPLEIAESTSYSFTGTVTTQPGSSASGGNNLYNLVYIITFDGLNPSPPNMVYLTYSSTDSYQA